MWLDNFSNTGVTVELGKLIDAGINIWDFDYPSYYQGDEKTAFEQKVIDRYRFREIGQETPARFLHYFRTRVREIMPYYIQLYKLEEHFAKIDDPFESYNLTETFDKSASGSGESENTTDTTRNVEQSNTANKTATGTETGADTITDTEIRKHSDTPQGSVQNLFDGYLTDATHTEKNVENGVDRSTTNTATDTVSGEESETGKAVDAGTFSNTETENYTLTRRGNIGVQPLGQEMVSLRNSFVNIDQMIIDELNDLFLMVY